MTFKDFQASKVPMTKTQVDNNYGKDIVHNAKVFCYADGLFIEVEGENKFYLIIGRSEYNLTDLEEAELFLWDNFIKGELEN